MVFDRTPRPDRYRSWKRRRRHVLPHGWSAAFSDLSADTRDLTVPAPWGRVQLRKGAARSGRAQALTAAAAAPVGYDGFMRSVYSGLGIEWAVGTRGAISEWLFFGSVLHGCEWAGGGPVGNLVDR